jgi:Fic family protein
MHSLSQKYIEALSFNAGELATMRAIGEHRGKQALYFKQSPEALESLRQIAMIESSESSNRLEGIIVPHKRIEALILKKTTPKGRSEQEVTGYRDALTLIHESGEHMPFTTNVILQLHSIVYRYLATPGGRWKHVDNEIVERYPDGTRRVRFRPTPANQTSEAMEKLTHEYSALTSTGQDSLMLVPLAILDFLCVHPFLDGNGRVARLLTLLLLYHHDYQVGRYISLERVFEQTKESYYETLQASSHGWHEARHDAKPWMTYFWGVLLRAYREFEERVGTVTTGRGSKTEQIRLAVQRRVGPFAISDIEATCQGISRDMIRLVLRQMRDEGVILPKGKGRGAKWIKKEDRKP